MLDDIRLLHFFMELKSGGAGLYSAAVCIIQYSSDINVLSMLLL